MTQQVSEENNLQKVRFYRNKRFGLSLAVSLLVLCFTGKPFYFLLSHIIATLFFDWVIFSLMGKKESDSLPPAYYEILKTSPEKMDTYNQFMINTRRVWFLISLFLYVLTLTLTKNKFFQEISLPLFYWGAIIATFLIEKTMGHISYPYPDRIVIDSRPFLKTPILPGHPLFNPLSNDLFLNPLGRSKFPLDNY